MIHKVVFGSIPAINEFLSINDVTVINIETEKVMMPSTKSISQLIDEYQNGCVYYTTTEQYTVWYKNNK